MGSGTPVEHRITLTSLVLDIEEELFLKRHGCTVEVETFTCNIILPDGAVRIPTEEGEWGRTRYMIQLPDKTTLTEVYFPDGKSRFIFPEQTGWMNKIRSLPGRLRSLLDR